MREDVPTRRAAVIQGMFGRIAPRYDLLNRLLSLGLDQGWRRTLAARLERAAVGQVLDVCTGTGDLAEACAERTTTLGCDFSLPMLVSARAKLRGRVALFAADSLRLPIAEGALDAVTVAFGVRNFESLGQGLAELARVLRPGGIVMVLEFSRPRGWLGPLLRWWMDNGPPALGRLLSNDGQAYVYLSASVRAFPSAERLSYLLEEAGLVAVTAVPLSGGVVMLYQGTKPASEPTAVHCGGGRRQHPGGGD